MDAQQVQMYVQIGETIYPLARAAIGAIMAFAKQNGGNADTLAQLAANAETIAADQKSVDDALKADGIDPAAT